MKDFLTEIFMELTRIPALALFAELHLKALLLLSMVLLFSNLLRSKAAARQHLLLASAFIALSCLPLLLSVIPEINITVLPESPGGNGGTSLPAYGLQGIASILIPVYLAGCLLTAAAYLASLWRIWHLSANSLISANPLARKLLDEILLDEMADISISIREHENLQTPVSWGLLKPLIILPASSRHWSAEQLRHVMLHECQHIKRLDWVSSMLSHYCCCLYWFNPLVWLASRRMAELAEQGCDDAVLLAERRNAAYAQSLLSVAREKQQAASGSLLAQAMAGSFLGTRIRAILSETQIRKLNEMEWVLQRLFLLLLLTCLLAAVRLAAPQPSSLTLQNETLRIWYHKDRKAAEAVPLPAADKPLLQLSLSMPELESVLVTPQQAAENNGQLIQTNINVGSISPLSDYRAPLLLQKAIPAYPRAARSQGISGYSLLEFDLNSHGEIENPRLLESMPADVFAHSSLKALEDYRYDPPRLNGKPVSVTGMRVRFVYRLDADPG